MKKHAYLIIAHKNFQQLQKLVSVLDDERNDLYILIDQKAADIQEKLFVMKSNLYYLPQIPIYWGDYSLIQAEISLLESATLKDYQYYHLISGLDLPLTSQDAIHHFFDQQKNRLFITNVATFSDNQLLERVRPHFFRHHFRPVNPLAKKGFRFYRALEKRIMKLLRLETLSAKELGVASNWCTLDHEFSCYVVKEKDWIRKHFKRAFCGDELFIPALVKKGKFENKLYDPLPIRNQPTDFQGNLRYINWWAGNPKTWLSEDLAELTQAKERGFLFSRKFDMEVDPLIIDKVIDQLNRKDP